MTSNVSSDVIAVAFSHLDTATKVLDASNSSEAMTKTMTDFVAETLASAAMSALGTFTDDLAETASSTPGDARAGKHSSWSKGDILALAGLAVAVVLPPTGFLCHRYIIRRWFPKPTGVRGECSNISYHLVND